MKGIVFSEFIEMVESDIGIDVADRMIAGASVSNDGAYTSVGTYDHAELIRLIVSLSKETSSPISELVKAFGKHLFNRLRELYPQFFEGVNSAIEFLPMVETYIHVEVRKLYPDAELPTFECEQVDGDFRMSYRSNRPFADLAEGMILACVEHFQDALEVNREDQGDCDGTQARFTLTPVTVTNSDPTQQVCPS